MPISLTKFTTKEILRLIIKSWFWLIFPLSVFLFIISYNSYDEAGNHLTPYSVRVRGYTRRDGTHINAYHRRPPGSVKHDAPYESKRSLLSFIMLIECVVGIIAVFNFTRKTYYIIEYRQANYEKKYLTSF